MNVSISITQDTATPEIAALLAKTRPDVLAAEIAPGLESFWRDRLKTLGVNKRFPGQSTNFWERQADSVVGKNEGGSIRLSAGTGEGGIVQRYYGGTITPKQAKALAIPINSESYGKTPADFGKLILIVTPKGAYLAQSTYERIAHTKAGKLSRFGRTDAHQRQRLTFLFKLLKSVDQDGDPRVLPTTDEFTEVAFAEITRRLN